MGLLSFFKRQPSAAREPADPAEAVQRARTTARRRLIGAVVLLGVGVIGFPLLFETQPRPIPVDIPIDIPRKEGAAPLEVPPARSAARAVPTPAEPAPDTMVTERAADAGREVAPPAATSPAPAAAPAPTPPAPRPAETERKPAAEAPPPAAAKPAVPPPAPAPREDAQRARALLEGKASEPAAGRFVVQVGAFADAGAVRDARAKVEKLGLKTYTQVVDTASGKRTRVRVGPFGSREEADKASARMRSAGLAPAVLTL
ncbi:SPOR domain-containing protein [Aquincola sp. J276]|uniref:SPOR domain-containing protein n=1 Tax=Aquincola sp. J276 TaxID=2898432 RepID=UPI002150DB20|nr:SPOR domain-containing protein [Aquincola sp. J276]MCR5865299.1 SPOR domain-containing protein [Aquincola sp. J276]